MDGETRVVTFRAFPGSSLLFRRVLSYDGGRIECGDDEGGGERSAASPPTSVRASEQLEQGNMSTITRKTECFI